MPTIPFRRINSPSPGQMADIDAFGLSKQIDPYLIAETRRITTAHPSGGIFT